MPQFEHLSTAPARTPAPPNPEDVALIQLGEAAGMRLSDWKVGERSAGFDPRLMATQRALARLPAAKAAALINQAEVAAYGAIVSRAAVAPAAARLATAKPRPTVVRPSAAQSAATRNAKADSMWARIRGR